MEINEKRRPFDIVFDTGSNRQTLTWGQYEFLAENSQNEHWAKSDIEAGKTQYTREVISLGDGSNSTIYPRPFWIQYFRDEARTQPLTTEFKARSGILIDNSSNDPYPNLTGSELLRYHGLAFVISPGSDSLYIGNAGQHQMQCTGSSFPWFWTQEFDDQAGSWGVSFKKRPSD